MNKLGVALHVGWLLGKRQLQHTSKWVTFLTVLIMTLTFFSNIVISGLLIGLVEGGNKANKESYTGDVFLSTLAGESRIQNSGGIMAILDRLDGVDKYTARYLSGVTIEANYQTRRNFNESANTITVSLAGIDPVAENNVTNLSSFLIEGDYLENDQSGYVLIGSTLLDRHSAFSDLFEPLSDVFPGDKIKLSVPSDTGLRTEEFTVRGVIKSKVGEISTRVFLTETDFRRLTGRNDLSVQEIAITLQPGVSPESVQEILRTNGIGDFAKIQTAQEAIPKFLDDIRSTFDILGFLIGMIVTAVGAITIFIIIYINAIVRRKQIGILKGVGINGRAIMFAYVIQALIYAVIGIVLALALVYGLIVPFVDKNPIDFPFSDGIILVEAGLAVSRVMIVVVISLLAGFVPSWLIVRQNTLDSILGR
ncbi:MAG: ABC transporter permease [Candidatus Pacebacteria bacterium]|nr:ABC transporter permease [Candidatus Paceibacterota bacterium]MCD8508253.1 ABC transporter permease [Candidatus Paceibacterota bacterium]MCD8527729.1 ABC transporter permease [Candidatus Paceibacterota bacterium]MCD8563479.1 ABC transporter permease [Candidatus Paceibacterota bacterium]